MLCHICQAIFTGPTRDPWSGKDIEYSSDWRPHCENAINLRESVQYGCSICAQLWEVYDQNHQHQGYYIIEDEIRRDGVAFFLTCYQLSFRSYGLFLKFCIRRNIRDVINFSICETKDVALELSGPQVVSSSTNSPETFSLAKGWLTNCLEHHESCNVGSDNYWRPTRLLELDRPSEGSITLNWPRKMISAGFDSYATLSHCWGHSNPLALTSATEVSLLEGVLISNLPQTFQDAIAITRCLGLKFIWIDSLCIFQDSHEDWVRESSLMGKVYSQAVCNIGATASSNGDEGCFRQRNPLSLDRTVAESSWTDRNNGTFHLILTSQPNDPSPLLRRGWVVQEHVLSRRFFHFDVQQVIFECRQGFVSEQYPEGIPTGVPLLTEPLQKSEEPLCLVLPIAYSSYNAQELYDFWARLVEYYSKCSLTIDTDKLVAISGIAKRLQDLLHDVYYAGIWKGQLPVCLLWRVQNLVKDEAAPPSAYLAPTWSWVSVKASVSYPRMWQTDIENIVVEVVHTEIVLASSNLTGHILSGSIKLRGVLWTGILHSRDLTDYVIRVKPIDSNFESSSFSLLTGFYIDEPNVIGQPTNGIKLHFMPVKCTGSLDSGRYEGLLLLPTGQRGQFKRIGYLYFNLSLHTNADVDWFLSASNNDWLEYEEFDGDKYTITIV
ncbi:HET-domain-containing protein [Stipitochalara longipes BDJ]|nr:HET-domain-containing protein [Stipitochalara longipes BDJ]